jgi:ABC-type transport system involved in Fe-S cluster assembly fused permease/ATPase subunit
MGLEYNSSLLDSLINYETIKYYCAEDYEYQRFREANER